MAEQLQKDKAKIISDDLEEITKQFHDMACEIDEYFLKIDNKLEAFSNHHKQIKEKILKTLNIPQDLYSTKMNVDKAGPSTFLEKGRETRRLRFIRESFKDRLIGSPAREPLDKFKALSIFSNFYV